VPQPTTLPRAPLHRGLPEITTTRFKLPVPHSNQIPPEHNSGYEVCASKQYEENISRVLDTICEGIVSVFGQDH
jgi:hypothetical protein